jgi:hypothetical protein
MQTGYKNFVASNYNDLMVRVVADFRKGVLASTIDHIADEMYKDDYEFLFFGTIEKRF